MNTSRLRLFQVFNSSLWITVLVVRVGCIIEAHPSPNNSNGSKGPDSQYLRHHLLDEQDLTTTSELEAAESQSIFSSPKNGLASISKHPSASLETKQLSSSGISGAVSISTKSLIETTTVISSSSSTMSSLMSITQKSIPTQVDHDQTNSNDNSKTDSKYDNNNDVDDDNCSGKADGYYQNFGSGCTSYYFCAAGYQITYVCPIGLKFNGKRCQSDYECPTDGHINDCKDKSNGYYQNRKSLGKYFYCFQQAKVIELQCDSGKVFVGDKCTRPASAAELAMKLNEGTTTCSKKSNGFYQDLYSNCEKYYYCIGGEKSELRCQKEYIFNGDICVHQSRYECPIVSAQISTELGSSKTVMGKKGSRSSSSGEQRRSSRAVTENGKLPIIIARMTTLENTSAGSTPLEMLTEMNTVDSNLQNDPKDA